MTNWILDSYGRVTQTQDCPASTNQGTSCTATLLHSSESWDSNNNRTADYDPRGNKTNYAYDANGNTVGVAQPLITVTTANGPASFFPTQLFDYDAYNNLIAYCDQKSTHAGGGDWVTGFPTRGAPDSLCSTNGSSAHAVFTYPINPAPSYEPFGELTNIKTPLGYNRAIAYSPSQQGGSDYGLPTSVKGDAIAQSDGSRTPFESLTYDSSGNLICSQANGSDSTTTTILAYDSLNRQVAIGDPDDASLSNSACSKTPGITGSAIVTRKSYYADGSLLTSQSPTEAAAAVSSQFQYDLDGDEISETHHYTSTAAVTQKWYDGEDRLVQVQQPTDPNDFYCFPWTTRYLYDLTQGGTVSVAGSASYSAYGGLYKTQEFLPAGVLLPQWNEPGSFRGPSTGTCGGACKTLPGQHSTP